GNAVLRRPQRAMRNVRRHSLRTGMPHRRPGPRPDTHRRRAHGPGGAHRPGKLPELPGPALPCVLSRMPADRHGHHARTATQSALGPPCHVAADCPFRALHRLRQVRAKLRTARRRRHQGAAACLGAGVRCGSLPQRLGRSRESRRLGHRRADPPAGARPGRHGGSEHAMTATTPKSRRPSAAGRDPTAAAIAGKGWWRAHRWLLWRRAVQFGLLALFLVGPVTTWMARQGWVSRPWWPVKGNLSSSLTLDQLPLTDPYQLLQSLAAGHTPLVSALIGAVIVLAFYLLCGGRVYCSWV